MNAKLSEYQAAVGLAALDTWSETRAEWTAVAGQYRSALSGSNIINLQPGFGKAWISSTCVVSIAESARDRVQSELTGAGIDTRMWWGNGVHRERATAQYSRGPLPVTESLANATLGLPLYRDLRGTGCTAYRGDHAARHFGVNSCLRSRLLGFSMPG